jgi:Flp pilus assembly protein protease CpaA
MTIVWWLAGALGLVASVEDLRRRTIPNWWTMTAALSGIVCAASMGWRSVGMAI